MSTETWVLVRTVKSFGDIRPYDVIPAANWEIMKHKPNIDGAWEEVARGAEEELRALVKLMPEARVMFDETS